MEQIWCRLQGVRDHQAAGDTTQHHPRRDHPLTDSVLIAEGTYTSLLKHVDTRIFIARDWLETLADRQRRNRGTEVGDAFTEQVLSTEHKIIAGHKQLADFVITKDDEVVAVP
jgi:hypothetical protein